ncbi:MAG: YggS family pyridoxal phosphate-dependent enzyme [Chloroflexi bacterium]|mgnify:FL=1|jgi:hypothetical protein|nr:YggS family pyridoxal phosphate-dependent enzyme [Chloroflexota bacterium]
MNSEVDSELVEQVAHRLAVVRRAVAESAAKAGRRAEDIEIVTVSKRQPEALIRAAYSCGLRCFGENYAEEALAKINNLTDLPGLRWDIVGHIQSRKAKLIASKVSRVHSVDSLKLAGLLSQLRQPDLAPLDVLIEVNISGEASKEGFTAESREDWQVLLPAVEAVSRMPGLRLRGLMTMPPLQAEMENNRIFFRKTRELLQFLNDALPGLHLDELSMGTSSDFPVAVQEGATLIRLGEAILGPRPAKED